MAIRASTPSTTLLFSALLCLTSCSSNPAAPTDLGSDDGTATGETHDASTPAKGSAGRDGGATAKLDGGGKVSSGAKADAAQSANPPDDTTSNPSDDTDAGRGPGGTTKGDAATASNSGDAGKTPAAAQSCTGKTAWKPGDTNSSIMVGGLKRTYILHVPTGYKGDKPIPLILDFHPMIFGTAASERMSSGYAELGDKEGFAVAYADGIDNAWNMGPCCTMSRDVDDFGLALAMVDKFKTEGCVDEKRVYAVGYSNGGGLSHYLACKHAEVFAAAAPAAFDLIEEVKCEPSRPIAMIVFRGTADPIVPYAGGASTPPTSYPLDPIHFLGAEGTFKKWAEVDGCTGTPTDGTGGCSTYTECKDGVTVTLCTAQGGSHVGGDANVAWATLKKFTLP